MTATNHLLQFGYISFGQHLILVSITVMTEQVFRSDLLNQGYVPVCELS